MTIYRFDQIAENIRVPVMPKPEDSERYIGLEHLDSGFLRVRHWGTEVALIGQKLKMKEGDVLFARRNAYIRRVAVAPFDGVFSAHGMILRAKTDVCLHEFLPVFMQSDYFMERAIKISVGSLSPTINWSALAVEEFDLPSIEEQRHIADSVWAADDVVDKNETLLGEARRIKAAWFENWISNHLDKTYVSRLENAILEIVAGKSPQNSGRPANADEHGVLKVSAVGDFGFVEEENKVLFRESDYIPSLEVKPGFLLVTRANALLSGIGRACYVQKTRPGLMLSDKTLRLVVDYTKTTDKFLFQALKCSLYRNYVEKSASGTDAKNISQAKLNKAPIPLPPLEEQKRIEMILSSFDLVIDSAIEHLENSQTLKSQLLKKYITG